MVTLRKLRRDDVEQLKRWGLHNDIYYTHYDFRNFNERDFLYWYASKQKPPIRWIYAIVDRGIVVGFVTMKHINWFVRSGEFGLVIDPSKLNCGYGTEGLKKFMYQFFMIHKMWHLKLKVAAFNSRAKAVYDALGFEVYKTDWYRFEDQSRNFELILETKDFSQRSNGLYTLTHIMGLQKKKYLERIKKDSRY